MQRECEATVLDNLLSTLGGVARDSVAWMVRGLIGVESAGRSQRAVEKGQAGAPCVARTRSRELLYPIAKALAEQTEIFLAWPGSTHSSSKSARRLVSLANIASDQNH